MNSALDGKQGIGRPRLKSAVLELQDKVGQIEKKMKNLENNFDEKIKGETQIT